MNSIKIWETIRSKNANCSLPVAVRVSKTRVLKLPNCFVVTPARYEVGQFFFSVLFLYFFQKLAYLFKKKIAHRAEIWKQSYLRVFNL